jgi:hypothetical protein
MFSFRGMHRNAGAYVARMAYFTLRRTLNTFLMVLSTILSTSVPPRTSRSNEYVEKCYNFRLAFQALLTSVNRPVFSIEIKP